MALHVKRDIYDEQTITKLHNNVLMLWLSATGNQQRLSATGAPQRVCLESTLDPYFTVRCCTHGH